jgi:hypothetical protein
MLACTDVKLGGQTHGDQARVRGVENSMSQLLGHQRRWSLCGS